MRFDVEVQCCLRIWPTSKRLIKHDVRSGFFGSWITPRSRGVLEFGGTFRASLATERLRITEGGFTDYRGQTQSHE